jgi:hypothetical protein
MAPTQRTDDDYALLTEAQCILDRAEREGIGICRLPIWMLEALIERAQRPHD